MKLNQHAILYTSCQARETLLDGLTILRNRGYDSCGMATIDEDKNIVVSDVRMCRQEREREREREGRWLLLNLNGLRFVYVAFIP